MVWSSPRLNNTLNPPASDKLDPVFLSPAQTKHTHFEKDSDTLHVATFKIYFDFSLNLREVNTVFYHKTIKTIYKTIKQIDNTTIIVKYKGEEEEIIKKIETAVAVKAKNTLLNYTEAIPQFLW